MAVVQGVVQEIKQNQRVVQGQNKIAYDLIVGGQKYGAGFFAPKCNVGDYVTFESTQNGNFYNVAPRSLSVGKAPPGEAVAVAAKNVAAGAGSFDKRQDAISRQAASNTAIAFLNLLASQDALPVPASKGKGDKQAALEMLLRGYEQRFYEENTGVKWTSIAPASEEQKAAGSVEPDAPLQDDPWET
ncbi:hypothetical protein [Xanthomonas phage DES1]|nr:hypothetical protein [Xanthomonas phage DES1]